MEPVSTVAIVAQLFSVADKILDKVPTYEERKKNDYLELKKQFNVYKDLPVEERVNSYLFNLKKELANHLVEMAGAL